MEPLDHTFWYAKMRRIAVELESAETNSVERQIRQAFHIGMLAPISLQALYKPEFSEVEMESLLEQRHLDRAARALFCADIQISDVFLDGLVRVTIAGALFSEPIEKTAPTFAQAALMAWVQMAFFACNLTSSAVTDRDLRKSQF